VADHLLAASEALYKVIQLRAVYGTTHASLYPGLGQYSNVLPDFYPSWSDRPRH
jgi:hypothetical protein